MESTNTTPPEVSRVAVRLPPFWPERPDVWFLQADSQFSIAGISQEVTKFHYIVSHLDQRYAEEIDDLIASPPQHNPYTTLRTTLLKRLSFTLEQRHHQLMNLADMGDRTPSQFLRYIRRLAPDASDSLLRSFWIKHLPSHVQFALSCQSDANLEAAAEYADRIFASNPSPFSVTSGTIRTFPSEYRRSPSPDHHSTSEVQHSTHLNRRSPSRRYFTSDRQSSSPPRHSLNRRSSSRRRSYTPSSRQYRRTSPSSSFRRENNSPICWYHQRFGRLAHNCTPPCSYQRQGKLTQQTSTAAHVCPPSSGRLLVTD
jgi:hypothetical protein